MAIGEDIQIFLLSQCNIISLELDPSGLLRSSERILFFLKGLLSPPHWPSSKSGGVSWGVKDQYHTEKSDSLLLVHTCNAHYFNEYKTNKLVTYYCISSLWLLRFRN